MTNKMSILLVTVGAALFCALPAMAANTQAVIPACGLNGTGNGLAITVDGSTNQTYVVSQHPTDEQTFNIDFKIRLSDLTTDLDIQNETFFVIMRGIETAPASRQNLRLQIRRRTSGVYTLFVIAWHTNQNKVRFVGSTPITSLVGEQTFRLEWIASTGPNAFNGTVRLFKNTNMVLERTNWPNNGEIDQVRFGFPSSGVVFPDGTPDATASGVVCLDEYISTR